jgi:hypothetical protein
MLATSYSPLTSTIATTALNFCVRNENRCFHSVKSPAYNIHFLKELFVFTTGRASVRAP